MAQDIAVAEITRGREPTRSERVDTSDTKSHSMDTTRVEPIEKVDGNATEDSTQHREESPESGNSTRDIDGRGDNVNFLV